MTRSTDRRPRRVAAAVLAGAVVLLASCAAPEPPAEPEPPVAEPGVEFSDGFEDGTTEAWLELEKGAGLIEVVQDPVRAGENAVRLTTDPAVYDDGENPRTQLNGPVLFDEGDEAFVGWSTFIPTDAPEVPEDVWTVFFEFHGEPFDGSPLPGTIGIDEQDGQQVLSFSRGEQYDFDVPWTAPLEKGRWIDFVMHVGFSQNEDAGFVELWMDGVPQTFTDGSTRLQQSTMMDGQDEGLFPILTNYSREDGIPGPYSVFHDNLRVAESYEIAVAPAPVAAG